MATWINPFKLGLVGYEIDLPCQIKKISFAHMNVEATQRNLEGDLYITRFKNNVPKISLTIAKASESVAAAILGFYNSLDILNFIATNGLRITNQGEISTSTTTVQLTNTGATGITIVGVFAKTDPLGLGTNYFTSGSFDPSTLIITLGSALGATNTAVYVSYTFTGHSVKVDAPVLNPLDGALRGYWGGSVQLLGA